MITQLVHSNYWIGSIIEFNNYIDNERVFLPTYTFFLNMNIPIFDGTIHPDEWVNQVQTICMYN